MHGVSLEISELGCQCQVWEVPRTQALAGIIAFSGVYRHGSEGADDARFIRWRIDELCQMSMPQTIEGLIVDLRHLEYEWGDDLTIDPASLPRRAPLRVLVREAQVAAFKGVLGEERLRVDAEETFAEVSDAIRSPRSS